MGTPLPPIGEPLPPDVEKRISVLVAQAATRVAATNEAKAEQQRIQEQQEDPLIQAKQKEVQIKESEVQRKAQSDQAKIQLETQEMQRKAQSDQARIQLETQKAAAKDAVDKSRIASQERIAGASIGQKIASDLLDEKKGKAKEAREDYRKGVDIGIQVAKDNKTNEE